MTERKRIMTITVRVMMERTENRKSHEIVNSSNSTVLDN